MLRNVTDVFPSASDSRFAGRPRQRRWPSESPIAWAFWRRAPAVRFMALAMEVTGVFFFE